MTIQKILIVIVAALLFLGCTTTATEQSKEPEKKVVGTTPQPELTQPKTPEEIIKEKEVILEPKEPEIEMKDYTSPDEKISFKYPITWKLKTIIPNPSGGYLLELLPSDSATYKDDKVQIIYSASLTSLDYEQDRLETNGQKTERITINNEEFLTYIIEVEPLPGRLMKERNTMIVKSGNVFRIKLTTSTDDFDELLPDYDTILKTIEIA